MGIFVATHNKICYAFLVCQAERSRLTYISVGVGRIVQQTDFIFPVSVAGKVKLIATIGCGEERSLLRAASGAVLMVSGEANLLQITACGCRSIYAPACCQQRAVHEWS